MSRLHFENHPVERIGCLCAAVLRANDDIISTASLIVGVAAAAMSSAEIPIAAVAAIVAGAMSMAVGEYTSVSPQSDTENAVLARERKDLTSNPASELDELANIYVRRSIYPSLARQVARQLMANDVLAAHARNSLGLQKKLPRGLCKPR